MMIKNNKIKLCTTLCLNDEWSERENKYMTGKPSEESDVMEKDEEWPLDVALQVIVEVVVMICDWCNE